MPGLCQVWHACGARLFFIPKFGVCSIVSDQVSLPAPGLQRLMDLEVEVSAPIEVGRTAQGLRRVIPITGGRFRGPHFNGRVLPGGADFQVIATDSLAILEARYVIETDAGDRIYVDNQALRGGPPELIAKLARGEPVDPEQIYFRCVPRFEVASPALQWLTEKLFIGTGARFPDRVCLSVFQVA